MKKLMIAAALAACGAMNGFPLESANVVGYQNKASRGGFNYVTPSFRAVGGADTIDMQELQLEASVGALEANLQFLNSGSGCEAYYWWLDPETAPGFGAQEGKGGWFVEDEDAGFVLPDPAVMLNEGDGVQIDYAEDAKLVMAGQVGDANITYVAKRDGFSYIGNAFPVENDIQNIQLDASVGALEANLQFLNSGSGCDEYYWWLDAETAAGFGAPEGKGGWFVEDEDAGFVLPDPAKMLAPGESIQIDTVTGKTITIYSPVEL